VKTASVVDAAKALAPRVAELAEQGERERRLPAELVAEFKAAGLFSMCVPLDLGGGQVPVLEMVGDRRPRLARPEMGRQHPPRHRHHRAAPPAAARRAQPRRFPAAIALAWLTDRPGRLRARDGQGRFSARRPAGSQPADKRELREPYWAGMARRVN
jgi:alkylation response protein AidB-like acyl-CoA dehydrogenase